MPPVVFSYRDTVLDAAKQQITVKRRPRERFKVREASSFSISNFAKLFPATAIIPKFLVRVRRNHGFT